MSEDWVGERECVTCVHLDVDEVLEPCRSCCAGRSVESGAAWTSVGELVAFDERRGRS